VRLNVIQCDNCEKWVKAVQSYGELDVPGGWLTLSQMECETQHFCSLLCLRGKIVKLFDDTKSDHTPYPYCCAEHYPLPERRKP
jgi:hypothetical protein